MYFAAIKKPAADMVSDLFFQAACVTAIFMNSFAPFPDTVSVRAGLVIGHVRIHKYRQWNGVVIKG